jgi:hypothetical protein
VSDQPSDDVDYTRFRVVSDGLPTGLSVLAESETEAGRKLAIASNRIGFGVGSVSLEATS